MRLFRLKSIGARITVPTIVLTCLLLSALGAIMVIRDTSNAKSMIDSKGLALLRLLEKISIPYLDNYDYPSLDGFVQEAVKDPDIAFVVFYDAKNKPVTKSSQEPADTSRLLIHEREIANSAKTVLGRIKLGYSQEKLTEHQKQSIQVVAAAVLGATVLMVAGLLLIARGIARPLGRVIEGLEEGGAKVSGASEVVASASQQLSEGASQQAAAVEETSATLEELSSMTRQNAQNARHANDLMSATSSIVDQARGSMNDLTASMREISEASRETSKIIKTIDEIAFQTNLLALNAAVEAARAGEAGAGFAVVADEVRNLAMRAAEAAKSTANMIEATVTKVKTGSEIVSKAYEAFAEVAEGAQKSTGLVGEIAAATSEQALGIEQLANTVMEIDKLTQRNAAGAQESASVSEQMKDQARRMKNLVQDMVSLAGN